MPSEAGISSFGGSGRSSRGAVVAAGVADAGGAEKSGGGRSARERAAGGTVDNEWAASENAVPRLGGASVIEPCAVVPARVLDESAARVRPIARETVEKVKKAMGLYTPNV